MAAFDAERVSRTVTDALAGPGGIALVVNVFAGLPGVTHTAARRGMFRSQPARLQIGDWRYEVTPDNRLSAAHVVAGIVIGEEVVLADAVGPHLARSLGQIVARHGSTVIPYIDAAVDALRAGAG
ncbi:DUF5073 family protein [Mycobacterium cookii]|uniref:DUF5073 domain-containing protein n=1 Tax=Mycobacterium cookii TaxID=1775 RepID=A0A7I7L3V9_9MYCO|nr:DUF5073 family protein [Mycobacterium cookii]MCV7328896.1 DUF5073 family protein [Mycobacterium cookii]BBX48438.1 DUF5073 domain-containing protein [Mycobacterium cookii]